jgi:short-subunit dehydrogenase
MARPIIFVTGSTDGTGKATATELLSGSAEVIIHSRNPKKGQKVQKELKEKTGLAMSKFGALNEQIPDTY